MGSDGSSIAATSEIEVSFSHNTKPLLWFLGASEISSAISRQAQLSAGSGRCNDGGGEGHSQVFVVGQGVDIRNGTLSLNLQLC